MEQFLRQLQTIPEVAELIRRVEDGGCPAAVSGLQPVQRACVGAAVAAGTNRPAVFLCGDEREVQVLSADLETLTGRRPVTLLGREWQFRPGAVGSRDWERSRRAALYALAQGDAPVVVATADGLMARTLPPETLRSLAITLEVGGQAELGALAEQLLSAGYTRCEQVEGVGQFALRGGILDVFSPLMDQPVRCEFFDDEIDSMGLFDVNTQRRVEVICPVYATHTKARLNHILDILLRDTVKARALDSEGSYQKKVPAPGAPGLSSFFTGTGSASARYLPWARSYTDPE